MLSTETPPCAPPNSAAVASRPRRFDLQVAAGRSGPRRSFEHSYRTQTVLYSVRFFCVLPGSSIRVQGQAGRRVRCMWRPQRPGRQAAGKENQAISK